MATLNIDSLRQWQLVILRRLRKTPLTEFELAGEVAEHSGYSGEESADRMQDWLEELREMGLIWVGALTNLAGQQLMAAALTGQGRRMVC